MKILVKILIYTVKTLKQTFRSSEKIVLIFIVPIAFLIAVWFLYGDQAVTEQFFTGGDKPVIDIGVVNSDNTSILSEELKQQFDPYVSDLSKTFNITGNPLEGGFGECFIENINRTSNLAASLESRLLNIIPFMDTEQARFALESKQVSLVFIITDNFTRTFLAGINHRINMTIGTGITTDSSFIRSEAMVELMGDYANFKFSEANAILELMLERFVDGYTGIELQGGNFKIVYDQISSIQFTEFDSYIPGFFVFVLFMSISGSAGILAMERSSGTLDRLKLSSYSPRSLFLGLSLTQFITTGCSVIIYLLSIYLLGFPGRGNPVAALIIGLIAILPVMGLSLLIASFCKDPTLASNMPGILAIPLVFLSGTWLPLPKWDIWYFNPFYSTSEALRKVLIHEYALEQVILEMVFIIATGSLILFLGGLVFHNRVYRSE